MTKTRDELEEKGVILVGYSLGGSVLLKFLAESSARSRKGSMGDAPRAGEVDALTSDLRILGAVTISAPLDLAATSKCLGQPSRWFYQQYLLRRMRKQALHEQADVSEDERRAVRGAKSIWEFDERFTAPRCGFETVDDYYMSNSAGSKLSKIRVPTLLIFARDDPFIPADQYLSVDWQSLPQLHPLITETGGHCGFQARGLEGSWHDHCIDRFVRRLTEAHGASPAEAVPSRVERK